jgi:ABC-type xylose transport system permease subunit
MIRGILAVIIGYVAFSAVMMGAFSGAYAVLQADGSFEAGNWKVSTTWIGVLLAGYLIAALFGGWIASKIAAGPGGVKALAVILFLVGMAVAVMEMTVEKEDPGPRTADVSNMDAMMNAQQPLWVIFLTPVIGLIGVSIGGRGAKKKKK